MHLGERIGESGICTVTSILCFATALIAGTNAVANALPQGAAALVQNLALTVTFVLSGFPQMMEAMAIAGSGKLDVVSIAVGRHA